MMVAAAEPAHVTVHGLRKVYRMAETGGSSVSLLEALRRGSGGRGDREIRALDGVSLDIREGERVGIIGRNGAGKTTLLSMISGVTEPDDGTIDIAGDVHALLSIGAVLRDEVSGRENVRLDGAVHGKSRDEVEAHIQDIIAFSELGEFIDRPVRTYSSGMKARLAFSMAAFAEPDILVIDEALSVGDAFFARKATRKMIEMTQKGRILILVSHSLSSVVEMTDRCVWMEDGRIVMDGDPSAVTLAYRQAVEKADEDDLVAKFSVTARPKCRSEAGALASLRLVQGGQTVATTVKAFGDLELELRGEIRQGAAEPDISLRVTRVDGRLIAVESLPRSAGSLQTGPFSVRVRFSPMILGVGLYRIEAQISDTVGVVDMLDKVFEVTDDEGQFGGQPLFFHPPVVTELSEDGSAS